MNLIFQRTIIFILIVFSCSLYSQTIMLGSNGTFANKWYEGELILKTKDTLFGLVKFENASNDLIGFKVNNKIYFKENEDSRKIKFKKDEVDYFVVTNNSDEIVKYAYVKISKRKLKLLKVVSEGEVNLYENDETYFKAIDSTPRDFNDAPSATMPVQNNEVYVKRKGEKIASNIFFPNVFKSFKKTAKNYFSKCSSVVNKIDEEVYKWGDLKLIVDEFNNCF